MIDGPDNIVIGNLSDNTYSSKQELLAALRAEIHRLSLDESKSIKESTNNKEFLKIDGFEHAITDTFEDEGYTGCNVVYTWHEKDIVEVEIWEQNDPVQVIDNLYAPNMMQSHYGDFDDFANDLQYKITRYMRESKSIKENWEDIEDWEDTDNYDFEAEYNQALEEVSDQLDNYGEEEAAEYLYMNNHIYYGYKDKIAKELRIEPEYRKWTDANIKQVNESKSIKITPDSKNREINIEDKSKAGDIGHPIKKGLGDRNKKLNKEGLSAKEVLEQAKKLLEK